MKKQETNIIYPPKELIFRVFEKPYSEIRVVILGQDPYHKPGLADGLSFSVNKEYPIPASLRNIFKELCLEFPERNYKFIHGSLEKWFYRENIFLLNSALTVIKNKPASHLKIWESYTDKIIQDISEQNDKCIFVLLGNHAKKKAKFIRNKERIILGIHPSPITQGFIGSNIFKQIEYVLGENIDWSN